MKNNQKKRTWIQSVFTMMLSIMMVWTMIPGLFLNSVAYAAEGDVPPHTKNITDNHDGTYTISLDVVGDSEKQPNNVNVIVIMDTSGSMTTQRMNAAKNAVNSLANSLYAYNTPSNPDTVEMALIRFATTESTAQNPTNSLTTFRAAVNGLPNPGSGGTNWEGALSAANDVDFGDDDQTFVVFVSDGNPTFRYTEGNYPNHNYDYNQDYNRNYGVWGSGSDSGYGSNITIQRCYEHAVDDAKTLADKVTPANFFAIGAFGNVDRMENLVDDAGSDSSTNYYSAQNTAALNQAISDILAKIELAGINNTSIDDGTTNQVKATSGEVAELLEVDESSYKYYRSGGDYGTMQPWSDAPEANFENGSVKWDLESEGILENGVRYTVTFDCYPSQTTYDIIAKLKNGDITYGQKLEGLPAEIWDYIVDNGGGSYSLLTNTNAVLSYNDTRNEDGQQEAGYTNPPPVATSADTLPILKKWEGGNPPGEGVEVPITVMMDEGTEDEEEFHTASLSADNDWQTSAYISVGIIKNGQALPGAEGHDFSFAELDDTQYRWEIDAPVVRPMLINGGGDEHTPTMLIKVDEKHPAPSGATTYSIDGAKYYVDSEATGLTATNYRRSNLNLKKIVTGEDAPEDATFPFTLTVNNSKAPESEPADDDEHNSDYWVWFSIQDADGQTVTDATVSGATAAGNGYYYAPSGTAITVEMKADWNLRFTNLPTGTTYTFEEGEMDEGFMFVKSELTEGEDEDFSGDQTTKGTIVETQTAYQVEYTNDYALTDLEITKVWEDADNQDGKRPTAEEFADLLTLSPEPEGGATPDVVDNEDGTYTITYTGLPKYDSDKKEIEYEVTEAGIDGYDTEGSPAKDHGTITNTHEPETIDIPVTKEWDDFSDASRPESITVILKADNETVQTVEITPDDDGNWAYEFTDLPKNKDGEEITYTIEEDPVPANYELEGITGDAEQGFTITNTYDFDPASITFGGEKTVSGYPDDAPAVTFTFTLEGEGESQTKTVTSNQTDKSFTFDELEYDEPGEYTYTVTETQDGGAGWTYDSSSYTVVVTVVDDGNGKLVASKEIKLGDETVDEISFENSYKAGPAEVDLSGVKTLQGRELKEGEFTFELYDEKNELVQSKTNDANGDYAFDTLEFDEVGTYKYTIKEKDTKLGGVTYDTKVYKVTITVSDDGSGTLSAEISGDVNSDGSGADFTNRYKADPTKIKFSGSKSISGYPETAAPVTFTFTLSGDASATQTVTGEGDFTFDWITLDEAKTYTFAIAETAGGAEGWTNDTTTYTITAEVEDNGEGQLVPTVTGDNITVKVSEDGTQAEVSEVNFLNKYQAEPDTLSIIGKKIIDDFKGVLPADTFTFQISGTGEVVAEENASEETPANPSEEAAEEAAPSAADNETADKEAVEKTDEAPAENADAAKAEEAQKEAEAKVEAAEEKLEAAEAVEEKAEAAQKAAEEKAEEAKNAVEEAKADEDADAEAAKTEADKAKDVAEEAKDAVDEAKDAVEKAEAEVKEAKAEAEKAEAEVKEAKAEAEKADAEATETQAEAEKTESADEDSAIATKAAETAAEAAEAVVETGVEAATETITAPVPAGGDTAKNDADGFVKFEDIEFTRAGTYTYTIEEIAGSMPGVTNDTSKKEVVVKVTDDGSGKLKAEITSPQGEFQFEFHNKYDTPPTPSKVTDTIPVTKELAGHSLKAGDFTFELVCPDGKVITAKNDADGNVEFPAYTFTKEGTYKFTVREKKGKNSTITYDEAEYTVTANVKNNYDGKKLEVTWVLGEEGETEIVFNNKYKDVVYIDPPVKKVVEGNPKKTETYTFLLEANDEENPMPKAADGESSMEMSIKGAGEKEFGKIAFTEPGAYSYTVTEVEGDNPDCEYDDSVYTVIATVTEDSNYKLHVKCDYRKNGKSISVAKFIFTNTYEEEPGKKVKTGDDNNLIGWLAVIALAGVAGGTILYRRRREDD